MSTQVSRDTIDTLVKLGSATVHEAQGQKGALDSGLKPLDPTRRLGGTALTVDTRPADNLMIHYALTKARPGDVLMVDAKSFDEGGPWGDILTLAAIKAGIIGLVMDGMVRDADVIIEMGFPVFARGLSIKGTNKVQPGKVNTPIVCGSVTVRPGDIVIGDRDGLVVVDPAEAEEVLIAANTREAKEDEMRKQIEAGRTTVDLLGLGPTLEKMGLE